MPEFFTSEAADRIIAATLAVESDTHSPRRKPQSPTSQRTPNVQTVRCSSTVTSTGHINGGAAVTLYPGFVVFSISGTYVDADNACWLIGLNSGTLSAQYYASAKSSQVNEDDGVPIFIVDESSVTHDDPCCTTGALGQGLGQALSGNCCPPKPPTGGGGGGGGGGIPPPPTVGAGIWCCGGAGCFIFNWTQQTGWVTEGFTDCAYCAGMPMGWYSNSTIMPPPNPCLNGGPTTPPILPPPGTVPPSGGGIQCPPGTMFGWGWHEGCLNYSSLSGPYSCCPDGIAPAGGALKSSGGCGCSGGSAPATSSGCSCHDIPNTANLGNPLGLPLSGDTLAVLPYITGTTAQVIGFDANGDPSLVTAAIQTVTPLYSYYADVNNSGTSETDIFAPSIAANTITANGMQVEGDFNIKIATSPTATSTIRVYFPTANSVFDTGAVTLTAVTPPTDGTIKGRVKVWRIDSSNARVSVHFDFPGFAITSYETTADVGSMDWTVANVLRITGQRGGAGAGSNQIIGKSGDTRRITAP